MLLVSRTCDFFFFQAEDGIRDLVRSRGLGDVYKRQVLAFRQCIIAAGSECVRLPGFPEDPRIIDSTGALDLRSVPTTMLVVGGGIIGLEMASVYSALGTKISVVELTDSLMPGCDPDLVRPLQRRIAKRYAQIMTCLLYTSPSPRDRTRSRMPSSA